MLYYNTGMPDLPMPEYGRNIQQMVDYCVSIPDREERTHCAHSIENTLHAFQIPLQTLRQDHRGDDRQGGCNGGWRGKG